MSYLSPEAARGENIDHRADIFAVGILLYEMLTSKRLFYGDTDYQTVELVRNAKIPPIAAQNPEVEPEFEEICRKALARRTEDRFQSATDLQDALAHYLFSRGLKMIQRDIAEMARACIEDQATQSSGGRGKRFGTVDNILHKELDAFTSFDFDNAEAQPAAPAAPAGPGQSGGFIDPRAWSNEADWPDKRLSAQRDVSPFPGRSAPPPVIRRDTIQEMQARSSQVLNAPTAPLRQEPSPMPPVQVLAQPAQLPVVYPPAVSPLVPPRPAHRGAILGAMAAAVVLGAVFAYWLFSGR
jgi:serine/threonine protein kinase